MKRSFLGLVVTAVAALGVAAPASARDLYLRPASTNLQQPGWFANPLGSPFASVLNDPVVQPAVPDTSTGYLSGVGSNDYYTSQAMSVPALNPGENVTGATAWVYATTGSAQSLTVSLWGGTQLLGWRYYGPGQAAAWRSVPVQTAPTADQANHLSVLLGANSASGSTPWGRVYASYVDLATDGQDPSPTSPTDPGTPGPSQPLPPAAAIRIAAQTVHVGVERGKAVAPLLLACPASAAGSCRGTVTITLLPDPPKPGTHKLAHAARCGRGCRPIGHGSFDIAAGRRRKVKVRMALRRDQVFAQHGHRRRAKVTVTMRDGTGRRTVTSGIVTLTG
jgi:hypothetical protein